MAVPEAAVEEYRYMLDRGYNPASALRLVGERHLLPAEASNVLRRRVFPRGWVTSVEGKMLLPKDLECRRVAVDLYNVLITCEARLAGDAFLSDDGLWRDARGVYGKYRVSDDTRPALACIVRFLAENHVAQVRFLLDAQVSRSGDLASLARNVLTGKGLAGKVKVLKDVDASMRRLGRTNWVVATSDTGIIRYVTTVVDVPGGMQL